MSSYCVTAGMHNYSLIIVQGQGSNTYCTRAIKAAILIIINYYNYNYSSEIN